MESERINKLDAILFALSLEVVLLQMRILEGSTEIRALRWKIDTKPAKLQREKLIRDRETVKDVIRRTLIDLIEDGDYGTMRQAVALLQQRASSAVSQRKQYDQLLRTRESLLEEREKNRCYQVTELCKADHRMAVLRDKIHDDQQNANVRLTYAEKWLIAKAESLELQYNEPQPSLPRLDHEERVHKELLKAYDMQIKEREDALLYWQQRFEKDTTDIRARIAVKSEQRQVANARRQELQKLFDLHAGEIRSWLTFKRERAARIAREERQHASATRIQAWWRGVMVRRALGAFRYLRNIKKTPSKGKKK